MKKVIPIIVVAALLVAGIVYYIATKNGTTTYGSNNSSAQMSGMSGKEQSTGANDTTAQATDKVTIENMAFNPADITVKKGTTVTWTNQDSIAHTVTETDGQAGPQSGDLEKGQTYAFTFNTAGTFQYHCSIHPGMTGTVTVTE